jgi:hypothetical protein
MCRVLEQVDESPAKRRHEIRHRRDVDQRDVQRDSAHADVGRLRRPGLDDPAEQCLVGHLTGIQALHRGRQEFDDVIERRPLGALVRRGDGRHRVGMHERVGPVKGVEGPNQAIEDIALRRSGSRP